MLGNEKLYSLKEYSPTDSSENLESVETTIDLVKPVVETVKKVSLESLIKQTPPIERELG